MGNTPKPDITALIESAVDLSTPEPFGTYLFVNDDPAAAIARDLEEAVFLDAFGNTAELLHNEYHRYEPASFFLCVIDHRRKVCAAMMRVIIPVPGGPGLKSLIDIEPVWGRSPKDLYLEAGLEYDPDASWDIATQAIDRDYRVAASLGLMHIGMFQALARLGRHFGVHWIVAVQTYAVYRLTRMQLRRSFVAIAGERPYLGGERSVPVCCDLPKAEREAREEDPILHELIYTGSTMKAALRQIELDRAIDEVQKLIDRHSAKRSRWR
jgi:hypothetical protein